jgi:hypothetical protein
MILWLGHWGDIQIKSSDVINGYADLLQNPKTY